MTAIGPGVAAIACAAGCWAAIVVFVIVVLIIVACVLEIGGPCWLWQSQRSESTERSNEGAQARPRERAEPIAPAQPMPTPPRNPNCIDNPWPGPGSTPQWNRDFPPTINQRLQRLIDQIFRSKDAMPGGTAGELRREGTGGGHTRKATERSSGLRRILREEDLSLDERAIAEWLLNDLQNALNGCP